MAKDYCINPGERVDLKKFYSKGTCWRQQDKAEAENKLKSCA